MHRGPEREKNRPNVIKLIVIRKLFRLIFAISVKVIYLIHNFC